MASNSSESSFAQKKIKGIFSKGFMVAKIMKILKEEGKLTFFRPKKKLNLFFILWRLSATYDLYGLTEVAGEGGPDLAPQKFLLSQQFRYLMRCKKYL